MEGGVNIIVFLLAAFPCYALSTIICGDEVCHGIGPYCCQLDSGELGCCWGSMVYDYWWFWFLWIVIFFLILACSASYWRRRRRARRMAVMTHSQYPTYGTVIRTSTVQTTATGQVNPAAPTGPTALPNMPPTYAQPPPGYSALPPTYAASEATKNEKPPAYSAI